MPIEDREFPQAVAQRDMLTGGGQVAIALLPIASEAPHNTARETVMAHLSGAGGPPDIPLRSLGDRPRATVKPALLRHRPAVRQ